MPSVHPSPGYEIATMHTLEALRAQHETDEKVMQLLGAKVTELRASAEKLSRSNASLTATVERYGDEIKDLRARLDHDTLLHSLITDRDAWRAKVGGWRYLSALLGGFTVAAFVVFLKWAVGR